MNLELKPASVYLNTNSLEKIGNVDLIRSYWVYSIIARPTIIWLGAKIGGWSVRNLRIARWAVRKTIFAQFCGGESVAQCQPTVEHLDTKGISTILDYSVEGAESDSNFEHTASEIAQTIRQASKAPEIAFCVFKVSGLGKAADIEAASASTGASELTPSAQKIADYVDRLCKLAHSLGVRIFFDAEETWLQPFIDFLAMEAMIKYNHDRPIVFNTYQLYLIEGFDRMRAHALHAEANGVFFGAKLVRGAYMEKEAKRAHLEGRASPINNSKAATDLLYDIAAAYCLEHIDRIAFCLGTHNIESCQKVATSMAVKGVDTNDQRIWFAQLLGMSDNLSYPLAAAHYNVAKYVPFGPVEEVIPYLIRRAQENTTVAGQSSRELQLITKEIHQRKLNVWSFFTLKA
jgi:proline dehydrogenase